MAPRKQSSVKQDPPAEAAGEPNHEDIQIVAYLKYLDSGGRDFDDLRHWLEAEALLKERMAINDSAKKK